MSKILETISPTALYNIIYCDIVRFENGEKFPSVEELKHNAIARGEKIDKILGYEKKEKNDKSWEDLNSQIYSNPTDDEKYYVTLTEKQKEEVRLYMYSLLTKNKTKHNSQN